MHARAASITATFAGVLLAAGTASAYGEIPSYSARRPAATSEASLGGGGFTGLDARVPRARGGGPLAQQEAQPRLVLSVQGGLSGYSRGGLSDATYVGPSWQVQAGIQALQWLAVNLNYIGAYNAGVDQVAGEGVGVLSNGGYVSGQVQAQLGRLQPYTFTGLGYSWNSIVRDDARNTPLRGGSNAFIPLGAGFNVQLTDHWQVGLQGTYQLNLSGRGQTMPGRISGGDNWSANLVLGWRM